MHNQQWLALETSTDTLSLAVARGIRSWTHTSAGGALTSTHMIPQTLALLKEAGLALTDLQAVVFGRGPGAFTGLRTACSVAQGLAYGADLPVLPIDTLLALAEEARAVSTQSVTRVLAVMDARMEQVYVAAYEFAPSLATSSANKSVDMPGSWRCVQKAQLQSPESLCGPAEWEQDSFIAAGNAWSSYAGRWPISLTAPQIAVLPTATALLRLAPEAWEAGLAVRAEEALPLYIRDKVAQTTDERMQVKAQQSANVALSLPVASPTIES